MAVIEARGLTRRFGEVVAVNGLDLEVEEGSVFGFLGHNGAGKTTTVRLLNGVLAPSAGSVRVLGLTPLRDGPALRRKTGVLTETPSLEEMLTGRENLEIYAALYDVPRAEVPRRVQELLETFELADRADDKVGGYSRGMRQRLALARALLHKPRILFLDEPTAGLDPVVTRQVHELIARISREERRTVLLCTHNLHEAQKLCDQVAVLEHGRLVALGTPHSLARQLGRSQRVEVEVASEDVALALEVLHARPSWGEPSCDGQLIAVPEIEREALPTLVSALATAGVRIYGVAQREPTLEDVYFALQGGRDAA